MLFMKKKRIENLKSIEKNKITKATKINFETSSNKELYLKRKEAEKEIRKISKEIEKTEKRIEELETSIKKSEIELSSGKEITDELFYDNFSKAKKEIEEKMYEWEILTEQLSEKEEIKNQL